jgi:hypothetical protein
VRRVALNPFATLLPTPLQTRFLRACVQDQPAAAAAWSRWQEVATRGSTSLVDALEPWSLFLPLLSWNLARHGIVVRDERVVARLRLARQIEAVRWLKYRTACHSAFAALGEAGIPFIALKGTAYSELIYPSPSHRLKADIDVLLREADLPRAVARLVERGWRRMDTAGLRSAQHLPALVDTSGHPIELHWRLLIPYYRLPYEQLWARSAAATLAGAETRVLSDADGLLHALGHGMSGYGLPALRWVLDAHFVLERHPALDWSVFVETARIARLSLPIATAVRYLVDEMGLEVPAEVTRRLERSAKRTGIRGRAAARLGARPWLHGSLRAVWQRHHSPWRRVVLVAQRLFPPPVEFALRYGVPLWAVPYFYGLRMVRYARAPPPERWPVPVAAPLQ